MGYKEYNNEFIPEANDNHDNKIIQSSGPNKEISQIKETKLKEKSNKNKKSMGNLKKVKPEKTMELEIAKQITNGTKLSKEQASEILELMKNNKVDINATPNNTENISENRGKEILTKLEKGFRKQKNIDKDAKPEIEESGDWCPIGCKTKLVNETYLDHVRECEKTIENCYKCGDEYVKNDIHWDISIHSKVSQRFSCMECMK